jgi:hypothetical protein
MMTKGTFSLIAILMLGTVAPAMSAQSGSSVRAASTPRKGSPDFAGRDKKFAYLRSRIAAGLKEGANFSNHYTIIQIGCGSGCTNNLLVDRATGEVHEMPWGGEYQQMLTFKYSVRSNLITVTWTSSGNCFSQRARWTGNDFAIRTAPSVVADTECRF